MFGLALAGGALYMAMKSQMRHERDKALAQLDPKSNKLRSVYAIDRLNAPLKRLLGGTANKRLLQRNFTGRFNDTVEHRKRTAGLIIDAETPIDYQNDFGLGSIDVNQNVPVHMRVKKRGLAPNHFKQRELDNALQGQRRLGRSSKITKRAFYNTILPTRRDIQPTISHTV